MSRILLRRGNKANLPALNVGEPGFAMDTKELFIGSAGGNQKMIAEAPLWQTWIAPTLQNGWTNLGTGSNAGAGYYKDDLGIVRLKGMIKGGTLTDGTLLFTLPTGYRPFQDHTLIVPTATPYGAGIIYVTPSGGVIVGQSSSSWLNLANVTFRAEQ